MKVLHIINVGGFGGAEKLLLQLLPAQEKRIKTGLLLCYKSGAAETARKIEKDLASSSVSVFHLTYQRTFSPTHLRKLRDIVNQPEWDLVHSHLQHANMWMNLLKRLKWVTKPVTTTLHGYRDSYQNKHGLLISRGLFFSAYYWISKFNLRGLEGHIVISNCLRDFFTHSKLLKANSMRTIYHGYDASASVVKDHRNEGRIEAPIIALPGRLIKLKGHVYAIKMLKILLETYPNAHLHFFGDGPYKDTIQKEVEQLQLTEKVHFHGYIHNLLGELQKCDFAVLPSVYESFGLVFLDCFAVGIPAVAFDLPAGNEIVRNRETGILVRPYDVQELAKAATELCEDANLRRQLVVNSRKSLLEDFSIDRMAKDYCEYYQQIFQKELQG